MCAGIAVSAVSGAGVEETADSALSLILQLYRRTYWLAAQLMGSSARRSLTPEQLRELPAAASITTIRGEQLGLVGLGMPSSASFSPSPLLSLSLSLFLSLSLSLALSRAPLRLRLRWRSPLLPALVLGARAGASRVCARVPRVRHERTPDADAAAAAAPRPVEAEAQAEAHGASGAAWHRQRHRVERLWAPQEIGNLICLMHPSGRYAYFIIPRARRLLYSTAHNYGTVWEIFSSANFFQWVLENTIFLLHNAVSYASIEY